MLDSLRGPRGEAIRRALRWVLPTWFVTLGAIRTATILTGSLGVDGELYRAATIAWLSGGDPWLVEVRGLYFAAPPPSLLFMVPFTVVPNALVVPAMISFCAVGAAWALRQWGRPLWWLAFPPLLDGVLHGNPHVLVLPLIAGVAGWAAPIGKLYVAPTLVLLGRGRPLVIAGLITVATVPVLPWGLFIDRLDWVAHLLRVQILGEFTAWSMPLLLGPAVLAFLWVGRTRAAWWIVPVFWPGTQYYYNSLAVPALTPVAALVLCAQFQGVAAVALIVSAVELEVARRWRASSWRPLVWVPGALPERLRRTGELRSVARIRDPWARP